MEINKVICDKCGVELQVINKDGHTLTRNEIVIKYPQSITDGHEGRCYDLCNLCLMELNDFFEGKDCEESSEKESSEKESSEKESGKS